MCFGGIIVLEASFKLHKKGIKKSCVWENLMVFASEGNFST